jgi:hypothetical protein
MTVTVTIPPVMSYDGTSHIYSDDSDPSTGLDGGGHVERFVPAIKDVVSVAEYVTNAAISVLGGATTNSTSTTSLAISTGSKSVTLVESGKAYTVGQWVIIASTANPANNMKGQVTAFSGTSLVVNVTSVSGSGTISAWSISVTGGADITSTTSVLKGDNSGNAVAATAGTDYAGIGTPNVFTLDQTINGVRVGSGPGSPIAKNAVLGAGGAAQANVNGVESVVIGNAAFGYSKDFVRSVAIGFGSGLWLGSDYHPTTAGSFVVGGRYIIKSVGTTDFTLIGAASNTVGISFVATGVGSGTGTANAVCERVTLVGENTMWNFNTIPYKNSSAFGAGAVFTGNNQVKLGDSATQVYCYGASINFLSDIRDKADVRDTILGLDFINALRPVDYRWDMREDYKSTLPALLDIPAEATGEEAVEIEAQNKLRVESWVNENNMGSLQHNGSKKRLRYHHGLIAQEVKALIDSTGVDFGGFQDHKIKGGEDVLSIGYDELIAPLIKAVQEISADFEAYKLAHP